MKIHTKDNNDVKLDDSEWQELADKTDGYSGSDIATLVLGALMEPIRHIQNASHWKYTSGKYSISYFNFQGLKFNILSQCSTLLLARSPWRLDFYSGHWIYIPAGLIGIRSF